ncbi:hypothetical protein DFH09DRAFT_1299969 [Mycena vulgaris]|nr:hypothetical protein DFH09DRAFT_1299969 [Mycena vulgaris]
MYVLYDTQSHFPCILPFAFPIPMLDLCVGKPTARLRRIANCNELSLWVGRVGDAPSAHPAVSPGRTLLALRAALSCSPPFSLAAARSATSVASLLPATGGASGEPSALPPHTRYINQRSR